MSLAGRKVEDVASNDVTRIASFTPYKLTCDHIIVVEVALSLIYRCS
jgi:hypothetical protein